MNHIKSTLLFFLTLISINAQAKVTNYFNSIRHDRPALYQFLKTMPKGGELHYHLAGGAYPEIMLQLAAGGNYCLDKKTHTLTSNTKSCTGLPSKMLANDSELYSETIKSWSFIDFVAGKENGHDHFFNSFDKFLSIIFDFRPELLVDIIQRAAQQNEHYLEIMIVPDNAKASQFGALLHGLSSKTQKRQLLLSNPQFQANITHTAKETDRILDKAHEILGCQAKPNSPVCQLQVKFLYYVLREQPRDQMFAQTLNAFEAVSRSRHLVGVNLVQAEDGPISLKDYRYHMGIFGYMHKLYPKVNFALHAGELTPDLVNAQDLDHHIHEAVLIAHAQRIGHGVDIRHENHAASLLRTMATKHIPVEINLISNQKILNVEGTQHPLNYYLANQVPVVLSTDDEGILRTNLTEQYLNAVLTHGLNYSQIKEINRNALTYSFLPGKNIWANASKAKLVDACYDLNSNSCKKWIQSSEKARLQWKLEQSLMAFEKNYTLCNHILPHSRQLSNSDIKRNFFTLQQLFMTS